MSATSHAPPTFLTRVLLDHRLIQWNVSIAWVCLLVAEATSSPEQFSGNLISLVPWVLLLAVVHLVPLRGWRSAQFVFDWPIQTAAALVLSPVEAAMVVFVASIDPRELKRQVTFRKALFNRSQIALIVYAGTRIIHLLSTDPTGSLQALPLALLFVAVTGLMNYLLVGGVMSLEQRVPFPEALRRLQPGMLTDFTLTFVAGGFLGVLVAVVYQGIGWPALLAFLGPILLGQLVVNRSQMVVDTTRAHRSAEKAVVRLEHQIYEERSDERRLIAADLHDEVLQPLFKVSLMAHVLKADLASGRLLEMDTDLPELLSAAEEASNTLRELIGDLRRSALGTGGLSVALARLAETIRPQSEAEIRSYVEEVEPDPVAQLALYQIAKEALSNATTHSEARKIEVRLSQDRDHWIVEVIDDGKGFDPTVEHSGHFGLAVMMERAAALGGAFYLDTAPGVGCRIRAILPKETA